jgi:hypothetical protein
MEQSYTENDLIQFIYRDMEAVDYCELLFSIDDNPELKDTYESLITAKNDLPKVSFTPSTTSMNMIMAYSKL